ncbi:MAG: CHAT domain-containing protein [Streptosporangiaceae bacterium]|nr:CHAT domain-containing protein [Streptosporangiaceae bacterium]
MIDVTVSPTRIQAGVAADLEIRLTNSGPDPLLNVIFTVRPPAGIIRLRGLDKITANKLAPGGSVTSTLRVRAGRAGCYWLTSPNFSYRDHTGQSHRETGFVTEITVDPEPESIPEPRLTAALRTAELPLDDWSVLHCHVSNVGETDVSDLEITLSGQVTTEHRGKRFMVPRLSAGASVDAPFSVRAQEPGAEVPVYLEIAYSGPRRRHHDTLTGTVRVAAAPASAEEAVPAQNTGQFPVRILFLGANPRGTRPLRVDEEIREIQQTIMQGRERDNIRVETRWAVRPRDITQALIDTKPHFVHFAGHGGGEEESFAAESDYGFVHIIPVEGLVEAFGALGRDVRCVIVNACRTERLADALAAVVPCVIGMREPVGDRSAIRFSIGFYQALAGGEPVGTAFRAGVAQLRMAPDSADASVPFLRCDP